MVFPKPTHAIIDIFSGFTSSLEGEEELAIQFVTLIVKFFLFYLFGLLLLYTSTALLEMTMSPNWLTIQNSAFVQNGWRFMANIASMFLILFLIVIALAIILKLETFETRKTLVRLILVALLINFTLVFIGALVDVSNILYNTFYRGNESLPSEIIEKIGAGGVAMFVSLAAWIVVLAATFAIPFVSPAAQTAIVIGGATTMLPSIIVWVFQIASFLMVSGMFFTYAILFVVRVYAIQLLAVISPLAFVAYIFPQTKKYTSIWLKYLLEWVFMGIFLFFFMALGLTAIDALMPSGFSGPVPIPVFGWGNISGYFIYFLFLILYLGVAVGISKKISPTFTSQVIGMAKAGTGLAVAHGLKPIAKASRKGATSFAAKQEERRKDSLREGGKPLSGGEKLAGAVAKPISWGHRFAGTTPQAALDKDVTAKQKNLERKFGDNVENARSFYGNRYDTLSEKDKMAFALYAADKKGGKGLSELSLDQQKEAAKITARLAPDKLKDITKHNFELLEDKDIQRAMVTKGATKEADGKTYKDKDVQAFADLGFDEEQAKGKAAYKKANDALKNSDVENLGYDTLKNENFQEMTARFKGWSFIKKIGEEKGAEHTLAIQRRLPPEEVARTNSSFAKAPYHTDGSLYLDDWKNKDGMKINKQEMDKIIEGSRKKDVREEGGKTLDETLSPFRKEEKQQTPPMSAEDTLKSVKRTTIGVGGIIRGEGKEKPGQGGEISQKGQETDRGWSRQQQRKEAKDEKKWIKNQGREEKRTTETVWDIIAEGKKKKK